MTSLEEAYGILKHEVKLERLIVPSGKVLEVFANPSDNRFTVQIYFPEFTCLCPRTSQPDFANIYIRYIPEACCVELKSLKYYLNSFRNEGHFHEEVTNLIYNDLREALYPKELQVEGQFNVRGGTYPTIIVGEWDE